MKFIVKRWIVGVWFWWGGAPRLTAIELLCFNPGRTLVVSVCHNPYERHTWRDGFSIWKGL